MKEKQMKNSHEYSQVLVVTHGKEKAAGLIKDDNSELANSSFTGQYNEEESARSFQAAVMQWRKERRDGTRKLVTTDVLWTPFKPALVSATSTQTDLPSDKEAEGQKREGAEGKLIVKLEFSENSLTHMERLLLKKHRRTPFESPRSQDFGMDLKPLPSIDTEEEMASNLTGFQKLMTPLSIQPNHPSHRLNPKQLLCVQHLLRRLPEHQRNQPSCHFPTMDHHSSPHPHQIPHSVLPCPPCLLF
ncbi:PREDICTED: zinc finger B-box domain-containing protein 1 [Cyprinodon variegatus]|uniref:zinc finger B-box domain-containing protein 1 n=1 Tax=Cyprinodon variegatus TaxID=28743 RepID=UPI0007428A6A|nr:PREDICTED: zinc finger B-box domain-containing protein 1 [Cyprinodon variegatus]